jgi:hypothetical protein
MVQIHWQGEVLSVRRLVLGHTLSEALADTIQDLAATHGLQVSETTDDARPGDFWLGRQPTRGWGSIRSTDAGWVRAAEINLIIGQLRRARRVDAHVDEPILLAR